MKISAFIPVYNEEKRIKYALTSLSWCDEIVVLDKTSSDKTFEIATEFGAKVYSMPNSEAYNVDEFDYMLKYCTSDWIILFTASDIMDVKLASEIKNIISKSDFDYDIIEVPYKRYILGIENKRSPWYGKYHPSIFKKSTIKINKNEVHGAFTFNSDKKYTIKELKNNAIHHLTHESVDIMMDRHIRYWRAERDNYNEPNLKRAFRHLIWTYKYIFWNRKTFLLGWDGVALICAYLSYAMMSFVYKWEKNNNHAAITYQQMKEKSIINWKEKIDD